MGWLLRAAALVLLAPALSAAQTLQQQIDAIFDALPPHSISARVENEDGSVVYYTRNPDTVKKPASVMKSFTVGTALARLGADHQFITRVYRNGSIDPNGILQGDLNLLGDHDFTWSTDYYPGNARFPLDELARRLHAMGLRGVSGTVRGYGEMLYEQNNSLTAATNAFRDALVAAGISASATATSTGFSPAGVFMTEWRSIPLAQACRDLMKPSQNDYADTLLRHIGWEISGTNTGSAGGSVVKDFLASHGISMSGSSISCGSGLCGLVSANQALGLTRTMLNLPVGWMFNSLLPIGGVDGTLSSRFTSGPAYGRVHAKTGTLSDTICLSGYVVNPVDHRRYLFTFLMNDIGFSQSQARAAIDDAAELLAGNINNLAGSVPPVPTLRRVRAGADGQSATVEWTSVSGATSYHLYQSATGFVWTTYTNVLNTSATVSGLPAGQNCCFMVRAANAYGESRDSDTYGLRLLQNAPRVLLVDGNDRWTTQSENPEAANHRFLIDLADALPATVGFECCANEEVQSGAMPLGDYPAVLWMFGEESTVDSTFTSTEQTHVQAYLNAGGNLFLSGAEIGWDLDAQGNAADRAFYNNYLKADYVADDAGTEVVAPVGGIFASVPVDLLNFHPTWMIAGFPDVIAPMGGSTANLTYISSNGTPAGVAGVQYSGAFRVVNLGFPFENITHLPTRQALMAQICGFLLNTLPPDDIIIEVRDAGGAVLPPPAYVESNNWLNSVAKSAAPGLSGTGSRYIDYVLPNPGSEHALVSPVIPLAGRYEVFATWGLGANCYSARYTVNHHLGATGRLVDQIPTGTPGANTDTWVSLGQYWFTPGQDPARASIDVSEETVTGRPSATWHQRVYADAFKLVFVGHFPVFNADYDDDNDIDLSDYGHLQACLTASNIPAGASCQDARFDFDTDVDAEDLAWFMACMQGPGIAAEATCRQ